MQRSRIAGQQGEGEREMERQESRKPKQEAKTVSLK